MKKLKYKSIVEQVSTFPNPNSVKWAGKQFSVLSAVLLWSMWLFRLLSPLQWAKWIYRKVVGLAKMGSTDNGSGRVNVPPMLCEIYFILWLVFFALVYLQLLPVTGPAMRAVTFVYLFESIVWVLYYTIFRRFFEARYTIYHEMEYLSVLLLVIPTQGLCFALRYGLGFQDVLAGLLGAGSDGTPFPVILLGALFAAIVISMIISAFPTESVKKYVPKNKMLIIGNGDVVQNRLLPVLQADSRHTVHVLDILDKDRSVKGYRETDAAKRICRLVNDNVDHDSLVWIETPTYTHRSYLEAMLNTQVPLIVLEKPLGTTPEQLDAIQNAIDDPAKRKRIFFLSYYLLEKALPLYYLVSREAAYEKYLQIDDPLCLEDWRLRLGRLESVEVCIFEGADARTWSNEKRHGGQALETFVHNALLASLVCSLPTYWTDVRFQNGKNKVELQAKDDETQIHLLLEKGVSENDRKRYMALRFAEGQIHVDLETQRMELFFRDLQKNSEIFVSESWREKYSIMVDLVCRTKAGELDPREVDGLPNLMEVNRWLLEEMKITQ